MAHSVDMEMIKETIESSDTCIVSTSSKSRRSRWGPPSNASQLTGLQTAITAPMTSEQIEAYTLHLRIEEITQALRIDQVVPADRDRRSSSPDPQYDASGRRTNTRYRRHRERLENERHSLVRIAMRTIPNYRTPQGYVSNDGRPCTNKEKVYIPSKDFPDVNFIGQLLGPRGRSLVAMNAQSGATISIRGKGSVKEGRGRGSRHAHIATDHDQQKPLHCLITANTQDKIDKAKTLVQAVIETAVTTPAQPTKGSAANSGTSPLRTEPFATTRVMVT